jgi:peptide/nickel transport system substrate-binding protein
LTANYYIIAPLLPEVGVAIQAELKRVGFDIKIENVSFARLSEIVGSNTHDILPLRWINADPSLLEIQFHSRNIPPPGVYRFNMARNNDPVLDQLLEKGGSLTDGPERTAAYADVQKRIMDAAIWFPIHNQVNPIAYRANGAGYRFARAQWIVRLYEVEEVR